MYQLLAERDDAKKNKAKEKTLIFGALLVCLGLVILALDSSAIEISFTETLSLRSLEESLKYSQQCFRSVNVYDNIDFDPESDDKYFFYSPSGGFSNQRSELEYGFLVAKTLGRKLILPKAGKHTTWWSKYTLLSHDELVPMDLVFDLTLISREFDFVVSNKTILELEAHVFETARSYPNYNSFKLIKPRKRPDWKGEKEIKKNLSTDAKVLFLKGSAMYHSWFAKDKRNQMTALLPFNPCLRNMALEIVQNILAQVRDVKAVNALHIRLGDYYKHGRVPSVWKLIEKMEAMGFTEHDPIYIATEPKRIKKFFRPLEKKYKNIFYSQQFPHIREQLRKQFAEPVVNDMLGMVEQLVCVFAKRFIGTGYSNFSNYIEIMRNSSKTVFPELDQARTQLGLE